jgi:uncharacterized protein (TIGR02217 family)
MAFLEMAIFPETIAFGAIGGPEYATSVVSGDGGDEYRQATWTYPRHRYQLSLATRNATDTATLFAFFHAVAKGRANGFRFPDFGAGESLGYLEPIGTGTGSSASYQLIKRYTSGAITMDRPITKPISGSVRVFVAGVETTSFTVDTATGLVTINATNGAAITASFRFHVPVRFTSDRCAIRRIDGGYLWEGIELVEVRDIDASAEEILDSLGLVLEDLYTSGWEYDPEAGLVEYYTTAYGD